MRRGMACLGLALCLLLAGCAREARPQRRQAVWLDVFDTVTVLTAYTATEEEFARLSEEVHGELLACHRLFDIYNEYEGLNNLHTVNGSAGIAPVRTDARVLDMLEEARAMHDATGGRVNVAMGAVLALWHEARAVAGEDPEHARPPEAAALAEAAAHTDISGVLLDRGAGTVFLADPAMRLDVGAIGKGWAVRSVCERLRGEGVTGVCLSAGGNIATIGARGDGSPWRVAVENPFGGDYAAVLAIGDLAAVTSGSYERFFTVDGVRYHHIIDPETLYPSDRWVSVTVLAEDSALADALSTALFNMDGAEALALAEGMEGVEALLIRPDGTSVETAGFAAFRQGG